jgi:hypothetical protein
VEVRKSRLIDTSAVSCGVLRAFKDFMSLRMSSSTTPSWNLFRFRV